MFESETQETIDLGAILGEPREPPPPVSIEQPGLALWFTVDTEASVARQIDPDPDRTVDELIFGEWGNGEQHGIGLHMDLLEHCGYRGCFFVDVLLEYQFGQAALERVIEAIEARGHEVELHVHPEHLARSGDESVRSLAGNLLRKDTDEFQRVMELAVGLFQRRTGRTPVAYRAGGYRITDDHFPVLEEFGIRIDASVNVQWHSEVSDWMKTRTQPYWVGDVLELPLTWILVRDNRVSQGTRSFAPNLTTGDPVSVMPASEHGIPRVATFVSHSFELMKADRDSSPAALEQFRERLRAKLGPEEGDKLADAVGSNMRLYDGTVASDVVEIVAEMMGRIADRPDARCVTCSDLLDMADRFPRDERQEPVDPVPAIDRRHTVMSVIGSRIYSAGLHQELSGPGQLLAAEAADEEPPSEPSVPVGGLEVALIQSQTPSADGDPNGLAGAARIETMPAPDPARVAEFDLVVWPDGFEQCPPSDLAERLDGAAAMLQPDGSLAIRTRTLAAAAGWSGPPIAELVFPAAIIDPDAEPDRTGDVTAWDRPTFAEWFSARGFDVLEERPIPRGPDETAVIDRFPDKLGVLAEEELRTAAVDYTLRRSQRAGAAPKRTVGDDPHDAIAELVERWSDFRPGDGVLVLSGRRGRRQVEKPKDGSLKNLPPSSILKRPPEPASYDLIVAPDAAEEIGAERFQEASIFIYRALRPGGELLIRLDTDGPALPSVTTVLAALLRAGFEVTGTTRATSRLDCRLIRPLELEDIHQFFRNG